MLNTSEILSMDNEYTKVKFLMHCRPKISFHLGNIWMLNNLYYLLEEGYQVIILIMPFDEYCKNNIVLFERLKEEIDITKQFYSRYLGDRKNLSVLSYYELDISDCKIQEEKILWHDLVQSCLSDKNSSIFHLIKKNCRDWALPTNAFVSKCVLAIAKINADYIICGEKHKHIAECFCMLMEKSNIKVPKTKYIENFYDFYFNDSMDRQDSVHSFIDITDTKDKIIAKLSLLENDVFTKWTGHFIDLILEHCPPKYRLGEVMEQVQIMNISQKNELGLFLNIISNLLNAIRQDVPYMYSPSGFEKNILIDKEIRWSNTICIDNQLRDIFTIIIKSLFATLNASEIYVRHMFGEGKSGAYVFELLIFGANIPKQLLNTQVIKIAHKNEIYKEHNNYLKYIKNGQTFLFVDVSEPSILELGWCGILYRDVKRWLGSKPEDKVYNLKDYLLKFSQFDAKFNSDIINLFQNHLFQTMYVNNSEIKRYCNIKKYYIEILPSTITVQIDSFDGDKLFIKNQNTISKKEIYEDIVYITEVSNKVRAYNINRTVKIDITIDDKCILKKCEDLINEKICLKGKIIYSIEKFYDDELKSLQVNRNENHICFNNIKITNPVNLIQHMLLYEHTEYQVAAIHGDLHLENIMCANGKYAIIDYGMVRDEFLIVHDIVVFVSDFIIKVLGFKYDLSEIEYIIRKSFFEYKKIFIRINKFNYINFLSIFNYKNTQITYLQQVCTEKLYYQCFTIYLLSMLKFKNLTIKEKQISLFVAALFGERS